MRGNDRFFNGSVPFDRDRLWDLEPNRAGVFVLYAGSGEQKTAVLVQASENVREDLLQLTLGGKRHYERYEITEAYRSAGRRKSREARRPLRREHAPALLHTASTYGSGYGVRGVVAVPADTEALWEILQPA